MSFIFCNKFRRNLVLKCLMISFVIIGFNWSCFEVRANENSIENLKIEIYNEEEDYSYFVQCYQDIDSVENKYYAHLPFDAKANSIRMYWDGLRTISLNGIEINHGSEIDNLTEGINRIECFGEQYFLYVLYGSDIPMVCITTESQSMESIYADRNYKEPGHMLIINDNKVLDEGKLEHIKGRGNSSWQLAKKSFNIKLADKKNLFGMGKSRKWVLLANKTDDTFLKNKIGYDFAKTIGLPYSVESCFVDLYINNEYLGHYLLCERVEIDEERINITDLEKLNEVANSEVDLETVELEGEREKESAACFGSYKWAELPKTPEIITGGYLLELELESRYYKSASGFVSTYGQPITIKCPEFASKQQVEYIRDYYQRFEKAVLSGDGYNELGKHYSEYIDMDSFAKMYLMQEFSKNLDGGGASLFFYKDTNGKLTASPVWDLDIAFGGGYEREGIRMDDPQSLWIAVGHLDGEGWEEKYSIFSLLFRHNDFREEVKKQWKNNFVPNISLLLENIEKLVLENKESIISDRAKWLSEYDCEKLCNEWMDKISILEEFVIKRDECMSEIFSDDTCFVEYNSNGGMGYMCDLAPYPSGTKLDLATNIYSNGDRQFLGWNTKASGWGNHYDENSEIVIKEDITLYAQWEKVTFTEKMNSLVLGIMGK